MNKPTIIKTPRLVLKSIETCDQEQMIKMLTDPLITKSYMIPDLLTDEAKDKFFLRIKNATLSNEKICYGIYLKDKLIGKN